MSFRVEAKRLAHTSGWAASRAHTHPNRLAPHFFAATGKDARRQHRHSTPDVAKMRTYDDTFSGQKIYPGKVR